MAARLWYPRGLFFRPVDVLLHAPGRRASSLLCNSFFQVAGSRFSLCMSVVFLRDVFFPAPIRDTSEGTSLPKPRLAQCRSLRPPRGRWTSHSAEKGRCCGAAEMRKSSTSANPHSTSTQLWLVIAPSLNVKSVYDTVQDRPPCRPRLHHEVGQWNLFCGCFPHPVLHQLPSEAPHPRDTQAEARLVSFPGLALPEATSFVDDVLCHRRGEDRAFSR